MLTVKNVLRLFHRGDAKRKVFYLLLTWQNRHSGTLLLTEARSGDIQFFYLDVEQRLLHARVI